MCTDRSGIEIQRNSCPCPIRASSSNSSNKRQTTQTRLGDMDAFPLFPSPPIPFFEQTTKRHRNPIFNRTLKSLIETADGLDYGEFWGDKIVIEQPQKTLDGDSAFPPQTGLVMADRWKNRMQWIKLNYEEYLQDVENRSIVLQHRDDPHVVCFIPYSIRGDANWIEKTMSKIPDGALFKGGHFITLTSDPKRFPSFLRMCRDMKKNWHRLHNALKKKYGAFEYVCVTEFTKSGLPHMHILVTITRKIDLEWLRDEWANQASMIDCKQIRNIKISKYITKYIKKGSTNPFFWSLFWISGIRFLQLSKAFRKKGNPAAKIHPFILLGSMTDFGLIGLYCLSDDELSEFDAYIRKFSGVGG